MTISEFIKYTVLRKAQAAAALAEEFDVNGIHLIDYPKPCISVLSGIDKLAELFKQEITVSEKIENNVRIIAKTVTIAGTDFVEESYFDLA